MKKNIEFTQSQIKAKENGATMFFVPIDIDIKSIAKNKVSYYMDGQNHADDMEDFIELFFPNFRVGDKDIYVKEEFYVNGYLDMYYSSDNEPIDDKSEEFSNKWDDDNDIGDFKSCDMTKGLSRYTIKEILGVKIVRVQDISHENSEWMKINPHGSCGMNDMFYNRILKEANINRTYNDNDYVFLIEIKDK